MWQITRRQTLPSKGHNLNEVAFSELTYLNENYLLGISKFLETGGRLVEVLDTDTHIYIHAICMGASS